MSEVNTRTKAAQATALAPGVRTSASTSSRLILEDPVAFEAAHQPVLRSTLEINTPTSTIYTPEQAREIWESLSMEPDAAFAKQNERKQLLARAEILTQEKLRAQAQIAQLQAQLAEQERTRLQHPVVYAGAAALLGLGALYWLQRRKLKQLQEKVQEQEQLSQISEFAKAQSTLPSTSAIESSPKAAAAQTKDQANKQSEVDVIDSAMEFVDSGADFSFKEAKQSLADDSVPDWVKPAAMASATSAAPNSESVSSAPASPPTSSAQSERQSHALRSSSVDDLDQAVWASSRLSWWDITKQTLSRWFGFSAKKHDQIQSRRADADRLLDQALDIDQPYPHETTAPTSLSPPSTAAQSTLILDDAQDALQWLQVDEVSKMAGLEEYGWPVPASSESDAHAAAQPRFEASEPMSLRQQWQENDPHALMEYLLELRTAVDGLCTLGRAHDALSLLEEYIDSTNEPCAWAYVQAMYLCEQLQERQLFDTLHQRYYQAFHRRAPAWQEPHGHVLGLDGYARAATEITHAWVKDPAAARATIANWLVGPPLNRKLLQLPAYHDLLDLYEMTQFIETEEHTPQAATPEAAHKDSAQPSAPPTTSAAPAQPMPAVAGSAQLSSPPLPSLLRTSQAGQKQALLHIESESQAAPTSAHAAFVSASGLAEQPVQQERVIIRDDNSAEPLLDDDENDFVPTVSLLDLDYEFSSDVTLDEKDVLLAEKSVPVVKPGNFSVDFNLTNTQLDGLPSVPADLGKK